MPLTAAIVLLVVVHIPKVEDQTHCDCQCRAKWTSDKAHVWKPPLAIRESHREDRIKQYKTRIDDGSGHHDLLCLVIGGKHLENRTWPEHENGHTAVYARIVSDSRMNACIASSKVVSTHRYHVVYPDIQRRAVYAVVTCELEQIAKMPP